MPILKQEHGIANKPHEMYILADFCLLVSAYFPDKFLLSKFGGKLAQDDYNVLSSGNSVC